MTTRTEIAQWFEDGLALGATHLIVVCDTYDHEDYPVYAKDDDEATEKYAEYSGKDMQRVMEVYDLRKDKQTQLNETRAWHLPGRKLT